MLTSVFQRRVPSALRNPFDDVFVSLSVACLRSIVMSLTINRIYTLVEPANKMASRLRSVKGEQPQNKSRHIQGQCIDTKILKEMFFKLRHTKHKILRHSEYCI